MSQEHFVNVEMAFDCPFKAPQALLCLAAPLVNGQCYQVASLTEDEKLLRDQVRKGERGDKALKPADGCCLGQHCYGVL